MIERRGIAGDGHFKGGRKRVHAARFPNLTLLQWWHYARLLRDLNYVIAWFAVPGKYRGTILPR
jgi:hypothetical protein